MRLSHLLAFLLPSTGVNEEQDAIGEYGSSHDEESAIMWRIGVGRSVTHSKGYGNGVEKVHTTDCKDGDNNSFK